MAKPQKLNTARRISMLFGVQRPLLGAKVAKDSYHELLEAWWSHPKALGSFPRTLGGILERSRRLLESSWGALGGCGSALGSSCSLERTGKGDRTGPWDRRTGLEGAEILVGKAVSTKTIF